MCKLKKIKTKIINLKIFIQFWIQIIYVENYLSIFIRNKTQKNLIYFKRQMRRNLCNHLWK
jgi:hypothetical protein